MTFRGQAGQAGHTGHSALLDHYLIGNTRHASSTGPQLAEGPAMTFRGQAGHPGQAGHARASRSCPVMPGHPGHAGHPGHTDHGALLDHYLIGKYSPCE